VPHATAGPLGGLSFAVKDLFDVAGYPTSGGQPFVLAMSGIKTTTAPTVQRLLDAGARFAGKTITDELAFSMNGQNAHFGAPVNGAAPDRITGGSSSGSAAAVSNGLCDFALGSDTGGSVRAPANHCGLVGLRPTHGRISLELVMDLAPSFDTCGWFARDIATYARVADVLLGPDPAPLPATGVRLLAPSDVWNLLEPEVLDAQAGPRAQVEAELGAAAPDGALIDHFRPPLGPGVADRFAWAKNVSDAQVKDATAFRVRFRAHLAALLGSDGVLVMPTMPDIAPLSDAGEAELERYRNVATKILCIAGLAGFPQLSLPLGTRLGAPLGISLLGPAGSDRSLVRLAELIAP
jgi:amidase